MLSHSIALSRTIASRQSHATLLEVHDYPALVAHRPVTSWASVDLDIRSLEFWIRSVAGDGWQPSDEKLTAIEHAIGRSAALHTPILFSRNGDESSMVIANGRHTLVTLAWYGAKRIITMVPAAQVALFTGRFA